MFFLNKPVFIIPMERMNGLSVFAFSVCLKPVLFRLHNYVLGFEPTCSNALGSTEAESNLLRHMVEM